MHSVNEAIFSRVCAICSEVLELAPPALKADEHILLQGGDSLHLSRIMARISQHLGLNLGMENLADCSTPRRMAEFCARTLEAESSRQTVLGTEAEHACGQKVAKKAAKKAAKKVAKKVAREFCQQANPDAELEPEYPATAMQQGLWLAEQLSGGSGLYVSGLCLHLQGELNQQALVQAVQWLVETTPVLRSVFRLSVSNRCLMVRHEHSSMCASPVQHLQVQQCSRLFLKEQIEQARTLDAENCRFVLLRLAGHEYCLLLLCHHTVCDGWSGAVLLQRLAAAYSSLVDKGSLPAGEPDLEFQRYAVREAAFLQQAEPGVERLRWWQQQLAAADTASTWLWRSARTDLWPHQLAHYHCSLDDSLLRSCEHFMLRHKLSIFVQMLSAWLLALQSVSAESDQLLGIPLADRQMQEEDSIGCFTRLVLLRAMCKPELDPLAHAKAVAADFNLARQHNLPLARLVSALKPRLLPDGNAWFSQLFAFQNFPASTCVLSGLELRTEVLLPEHGQYVLKCEVLPAVTGWTLHLEYASALFSPEQIAQLLQAFRLQLGLLLLR